MSVLYVLSRRGFGRWGWSRAFGQGLEARVLATVSFLLQRYPLERAMAFGRRVGRAVGPRSVAHRHLMANLAVLHPDGTTPQIRARAKRTWGWFGVAFAELAHIRELSVSVGDRVELQLSREVDQLLRAPGRAAVLATAHVGPWLLTNLVAVHYGFPLTTTVPTSANPGMDRLLRGLLRALPIEQVTPADGIAPLSDELARGHKIALAVDGWDEYGHDVTLFGERMRLDPAAARLAVRHDCPMIPIHAVRLPGGRYRIVADRVLAPGDPKVHAETRAQRLTNEFGRDLDRWIRAVPGQWLCLSPRWAEETVVGALTRVDELTRQITDTTVQISEDELDAELTRRGMVGDGPTTAGGCRPPAA
jgi:KDO2-lipid IV(A) lauroyltransferase